MVTSLFGRFSAQKEPRYLLGRRLGGPQYRSGRFGEEKFIFPLPGIEPKVLGFVARSLTPYPVECNYKMYVDLLQMYVCMYLMFC
jgi:hypothetical protein